jgi:hypothetical protein
MVTYPLVYNTQSLFGESNTWVCEFSATRRAWFDTEEQATTAGDKDKVTAK